MAFQRQILGHHVRAAEKVRLFLDVSVRRKSHRGGTCCSLSMQILLKLIWVCAEWNGSRSMDCVETSRVEAEASHPISAGSIVSLSSGADGVDWPLFVSIRRADSSRPLVKFPWNWLDLPVPPEDFSVCTLALFFRRNFARRLASVRQLDCSRNGFVCYSFDWVCAVQLISIFFQRKSLCLSAP